MSAGFLAYLAVCLGIITLAIVAAAAVCVCAMLKVRRLASEAEKLVAAATSVARPLAALAGVVAGLTGWMRRAQSKKGRN